VGFLVDKVTLGQVFFPSTLVFPYQFHSTGAPLLGKGQKIIIIIVTFITGLHKKPLLRAFHHQKEMHVR
jgi:hypothetical protein